MRRRDLWSCFSLMLLAAGLSPVSTLANTLLQKDDTQFTQAFLSLEERVKRAPLREFKTLKLEVAEQASNPLYPYLQYQWLKRAMSSHKPEGLEDFLKNYPHHHLSHALRSQWLDLRFQAGDKQAFDRWYENGLSIHHYCQALSLEDEGLTNDRLNEEMKTLWLSADSLPKSCDALLSKWQRNDGLTQALLLERIAMVAAEGELSLLSYLSRKLTKEHQYLAKLWKDTRKSASTVLAYSRFPLIFKTDESRIITFGLEKLAWQQLDKAVTGYLYWRGKTVLDKQQRVFIEKAIALNMALQNRPEAADWMRRLPMEEMSLDIVRWRLAHHVRQSDWHNALLIAEQGLVKYPEDELQYWMGRSLSALDAEQRARTVLKNVSEKRNYYGFAASARLSTPPNMLHQSAPITEEHLIQIRASERFRRIQLLVLLGRELDARREWRDWLPLLEPIQLLHLAVLASELGWYDQAFHAFSQSGYLDDVERRFPVAHENLFFTLGKKHQVPTSFALAIARRESAFRVDAISEKGARGLMQLMPSTAKFIKKTSLSPSSLFEPETNLDLGLAYLSYLQEKWDERLVLVAASYNAGWQKVSQWLPQNVPVETDVWIDNIPYKETREYVKAVLAYQQIYETQLSGNTTLFQQLITDKISPVALEVNSTSSL